jgi:hypothetical protein
MERLRCGIKRRAQLLQLCVATGDRYRQAATNMDRTRTSSYRMYVVRIAFLRAPRSLEFERKKVKKLVKTYLTGITVKTDGEIRAIFFEIQTSAGTRCDTAFHRIKKKMSNGKMDDSNNIITQATTTLVTSVHQSVKKREESIASCSSQHR